MSNNNPDPNPACLSLPWGGDFQVNPDGSLVLATGVTKVQQKVIRRIFTNCREVLAGIGLTIGDYFFDQNYGLSATRLIGQPFGLDFTSKLSQKIRAGVLVDEGVDVSQLPVINYFQNGRLIFVSVQVFLLNSSSLSFSFSVPSNN